MCEEYIGVWELWERYKRGREIVRKHIRVGHQVYVVRQTANGFWMYDTYKVARYELQDAPSFEALGNCKERVIVHNNSGRKKIVPVHAFGHTVFTTTTLVSPSETSSSS